jgi:hypothetical protein
MEAMPVILQTLVEYGGIVSALAGMQQRVETYIGAGNLKYLLFAAAGLVVLLWIRQRVAR